MDDRMGGRYIRDSEGSWVPEIDPESIADRMRSSIETIDFKVASYRIVSETGGSIGGKPTERYVFIENDVAPKRTLLATIRNEKRTFYAIREEGTERIGGDLECRIVGIDGSKSEGYIEHSEPYEGEETSYPHRLFCTLGIPSERFDFIVEELSRTGGQLFLRIQAPFYEANIDRDLGRPWYHKCYAVDWKALIPIKGYRLSVLDRKGDGASEYVAGDEVDLDSADEETGDNYVESSAPPSPSPELQTMQRIEKQLGWLWWLAVAAIILLLWRTS